MPASLFNKFAGLRLATLSKKRLWQRGLPVNFAKFLRTYFFTEHLRVTASDSSSNRRDPGKDRTKITLQMSRLGMILKQCCYVIKKSQ